MLRKKLIARLGLLVVGFVAGAVVAIALLQGVLRDLDTMKTDAAEMIDGVQTLRTHVANYQRDSLAAQNGTASDQTRLAASRAAVEESFRTLGTRPAIRESVDAAPAYRALGEALPGFFADSGATPAPSSATGAASLLDHLDELSNISRRYVAAEQSALSGHLRTLIIGLTIAALIMTNVAIFVLVRTANMILRPVDELITGTRELAREHFDYRIGVSQRDSGSEFAELASAYNSLGAQLASNEQRKIGALQQLAVTLNHELNNAINIIELRLRLVDRRAGDDPLLASHLRDIHHNLARVSSTIASLRDVRRIVLTDYLPGQLMLDLAKSTAAEEFTSVVRPGAPSAASHSAGGRAA